MATHFLMSAHPLRSAAVEETFEDQWAAMRAAGFSVSTCPDSVLRDGTALRGIPAGSTVVYRGWMLNAKDYERLGQAIEAASARPLTPLKSYLAAHHLPHWYPLIAEFTPETRIYPLGADWEAELRALAWDAFFIKDYVKSLKTSRGAIVRDPAEIGPVVAEMEKFRGEIEGGLVVRRVEPFVTESEQRFFVLQGQPFSATDEPVPTIVRDVASRIPSEFFSIDVIRRSDGVLRVVKVGDGQVSDLVGWSASQFAAMWPAADGA